MLYLLLFIFQIFIFPLGQLDNFLQLNLVICELSRIHLTASRLYAGLSSCVGTYSQLGIVEFVGDSPVRATIGFDSGSGS